MPIFKRQYLAYFEGLQEKLYFKHIAKIINDKYPNIQITFKQIKDVYSLAKRSTGMRKIAIYDYDFNDEEFTKRAKMSKQVEIYYSNISFDLWLLLHRKFYNKIVNSPEKYIEEIRKIYKLDSNGKVANIKKERNINKILAQITLNDVKFAMENARKIIKSKQESDCIKLNSKFEYYDNPATNIYEFFDFLFDEIKRDTDIVI